MYITQDLYLTAYLLSRGNRLQSFSRTNGKTTFRLNEKDGKDAFDEILREYYADCGLVSGLTMGNAVKNLKNLLHTKTNNDNNETFKTIYRTGKSM